MHVPGDKRKFDERRNTSRVFPPPPGAARAALDALERWRATDPAHVAWIEAGAPPIRSEADHAARFGRACEKRLR